MPKFNLEDYETVEERIKRFYAEYPDGRIVTDWETSYQVSSDSKNIWVVKAYVYLTAGDQANQLAKATGYATETDGTGGANSMGAALENCETSAIGRALANMAMSGNKRASREEMQKVERNSEHQRNWEAEAKALDNVDDLRLLWNEAKANNAPATVLAKVKARATEVASSVSK